MNDEIENLIEIMYLISLCSPADIYLHLKEDGYKVSLDDVREECWRLDEVTRERQGAGL